MFSQPVVQEPLKLLPPDLWRMIKESEYACSGLHLVTEVPTPPLDNS